MPYQRRSRLGEPGGFGDVYACRQKDDQGRIVRDDLAIKYLRQEHCADDAMRDRFTAEVRYLRRLDHMNVVPVLASNLSADRPWMVMPRADTKLTDLLAERRGVDVEWAYDTFADIARGVAHAHERDVLHRDLKPDNILLFGSVVKVADFGLGKNLQSNIDRTRTGTRLGSVPYMAPEQWGRARHARKSADVYSLGAMLWEFVVGEPPRPFAPDLSAIEDERLRGFIATCCEEEPSARFPDAATALEVFEGLRSDFEPSGPPLVQLKRLIDIWWTTPEGDDVAVVRQIDRLLERHPDDEELHYSGIPELPAQLLDDYITVLPSEFEEMVRRYDAHVGTSLPFDYCEVVARIYLRAAAQHETATLRAHLLRRVLVLGASHNRYAVADLVRDFMWHVDEDRIDEVASIVRSEPTSAWYDHPLMYRPSLATALGRAFQEAGHNQPATTDEDVVEVGDAVRHAIFGAGTIVGDEGSGIVTVEFEDGATKRLVWDFAPIRKLAP